MTSLTVCIKYFEAMPSMGASPGVAVELLVAGTGPQEAALRQLAQDVQVANRVSFIGTLGYPDEFLAMLRTVDLVLLTNLNDEQPRVLFDAISQGCIPVCPDSRPYRSLRLPGAVLYRHGQAESLAATVLALVRQPELSELRSALDVIARASTIGSMHRSRLRWVESHVLAW